MPYETAQETWSTGVTLSQDEDWVNEGPVAVSVTRTPMTGTDDGGVLLTPGAGYPFNAGDTVYFRANGHNWFAKIWREVL